LIKMEIELATQLEELEVHELIRILTELRMKDRDAFELFKEIVEDHV